MVSRIKGTSLGQLAVWSCFVAHSLVVTSENEVIASLFYAI